MSLLLGRPEHPNRGTPGAVREVQGLRAGGASSERWEHGTRVHTYVDFARRKPRTTAPYVHSSSLVITADLSQGGRNDKIVHRIAVGVLQPGRPAEPCAEVAAAEDRCELGNVPSTRPEQHIARQPRHLDQVNLMLGKDALVA